MGVLSTLVCHLDASTIWTPAVVLYNAYVYLYMISRIYLALGTLASAPSCSTNYINISCAFTAEVHPRFNESCAVICGTTLVLKTTYRYLTLSAYSVGTSQASQSSFYYLPDFPSDSLFSPILLECSVIFFFFLLSFRVRACTPSTAPRASASPSRVSADGGG